MRCRYQMSRIVLSRWHRRRLYRKIHIPQWTSTFVQWDAILQEANPQGIGDQL